MSEPRPCKKRLDYCETSHVGLGKGIFAVIGPFTSHASDPEFQRDLELLVINYNRRHGFTLAPNTE